MSAQEPAKETPTSSSKELFKKAKPAIQQLVKQVLQDEREVMHMAKRQGIHEKILERVKKAVS
jgi:hypothetical protein